MKEIRKSSQFKKDFKRIRHDVEKVKALYAVVGYLQRDEPIPDEYRWVLLIRFDRFSRDFQNQSVIIFKAHSGLCN